MTGSTVTDNDIRVVADGFSFLEAPRWHDGALYVSDFYTHRVLRIADDGSMQTITEVPGQPSGLGWLPDGSMLVVSMTDHKVFRLADGELSEYADLSGVADGLANDMVVDAQGRAYVGNFGFDLMSGIEEVGPTSLALVDTDGSVRAVADGLWFPNGSMITEDGSTLIVNETFGNRISAFDIAVDGSLGERRDWATFGPAPETDDLHELILNATCGPDGGCLDAEGAVWMADALGSKLVRVREGGEIADTIDVGDDGVFACMLGGPDGRTLYACVAPDYDAENRAAAREARLMAVEVDVPRGGRP